MKIQDYSPDKCEQAMKYISCDALLLFVCKALHNRTPLSTVRMGDGEKAIIKYLITGETAKYLIDPIWLKEYGLLGANLKEIGLTLLDSARFSDWMCPNISGLTLPKYEILSLLPPRDYYAEGLYAHTWLYMGRVPELINYSGGIGIVCRQSKEVADRLFMKYGKAGLNAESVDYDSWKDYGNALEAIGKMKANLILVSAGPSGKYLCVEASRKYGKVVLDTGSALVRHWSVSKTRDI